MCGIAGIVSNLSSFDLARNLKELSEQIKHRGPDGEGELLWKNVGLAHRRLAILDLSPSGAQPMHLADRYSIVFNGEIFNYLELREELKNLGHTFISESDTEVLLHAWQEWGESAQTKFNGMWAFAILDKVKNRLWLSRDRFGVKPLYFTISKDCFAFSSEISPLFKICPAAANLAVITDYLASGLIDHTQETFFKQIFRLLPSHSMCVDLSNLKHTTQKYYEIAKRENIDLLALLQSSISLRLRSDVKVGACLSGGLDSSIITKLASETLQVSDRGKFTAIHASTGIRGLDESDFAELVASNSGVSLKKITPTAQEYVNAIRTVIKIQQEPFSSPSVIMQYFVMEEAARQGCKVMLDGQAADETFLGYPIYKRPVAWASLISIDIQTFLELLLHSPKTVLAIAWKKLFPNRILRTNYRPKPPRDERSYTSVLALQMDEIFSTHLQALLRYEDRNSMSHGIEARLPFMDYRVVELALSLPTNLKIRRNWQKWILRNISANYLPAAVCWRKDKMGFIAPTDNIVKAIEQELETLIASSALIKAITPDTSKTLLSLPKTYLWRLYSIIVWEKIFLNKQQAEML